MLQSALEEQKYEDVILISLKPQYFQLILSREKKYEYRKRFPNRPVKAFIYVTQPVGEIQAALEFGTPIHEPRELIGQEGLGVQEFIRGEKVGKVAVPIKNVVILSKPMKMSELKNRFQVVPPQSFIYLKNKPELLTYLLNLS
ncbi:putative transcriptional regulator [Croceifilum oryzae]|uniref:Transcriptional regulator n=1 Tax=Croceifilum oryzae TaxID=1553429 RepID=A0AAJ1TGG1_9BACL|nr:hypothetical protein [Croceifilum oryzae]MDQ0416102.1 putative transcriptional regulator [Croceifilum oryzae]